MASFTGAITLVGYGSARGAIINDYSDTKLGIVQKDW